MLQTVGEQFDTGHVEPLWAIFDIPSFTADGLPIAVRSRAPELTMRESDIEVHSLVKQSVVTRMKDGAQYLVRDFDHDGTGMSTVMLSA